MVVGNNVILLLQVIVSKGHILLLHVPSAISDCRNPTGLLPAGADGAEVPPIYIDRIGAKAGIEETYSRNSKGSLNLVLQQVSRFRQQQYPAVASICLTRRQACETQVNTSPAGGIMCHAGHCRQPAPHRSLVQF